MSNIFQSAIFRLILALLSAVLACVVISSDVPESSAQGALRGLNQQRVRYERAGEHSTPSVGVNVEHDFSDDDDRAHFEGDGHLSDDYGDESLEDNSYQAERGNAQHDEDDSDSEEDDTEILLLLNLLSESKNTGPIQAELQQMLALAGYTSTMGISHAGDAHSSKAA